MTEFVTIPAITALCYFAGFICKTLKIEKLDTFIPCICGGLGLILGLVSFYTIPNFIPASNWIDASAIGLASGFAATGVNQIVKQLQALKAGK